MIWTAINAFGTSLVTAIPITVAVAIIIFVVKELLEASRRRQGNRRKLSGIKTLLARELELNGSTVRALREIMSQISEKYYAEQSVENDTSDEDEVEINKYLASLNFEILKGATITHFRRVDPKGALFTSSRIPEVHIDLVAKYLLDVALLDENLFRQLQTAYDALIEIKHVRDSLIRYVGDEEPEVGENLLNGFAEYAESTLIESWQPLRKAYLGLTGNDLAAKVRLR